MSDRANLSRPVFSVSMLFGLVTVGLFLIPLVLYQPYAAINLDTYQYIAIAIGYLDSPSQILSRDAYTVGPVIPLIIAGLKAVLRPIAPDSIAVDVAIVKTLAVVCYLAIYSGLVQITRATSSRVGAVIVAALLVGFLPGESDTLSLNAELVCAALLLGVMVLLGNPASMVKLAVAALLSVVVVYTKLQALPVLMVVVGYALFKARFESRIRFAGIFGGVLLLCELIFFLHGGGILHRVVDLFTYSGYRGTGEAGSGEPILFAIRLAGRLIRYFSWPLAQLVRIFPLFFAAALLIVSGKAVIRETRDKVYIAALFAMTMLSIVFSGHFHMHYAFLGIPLLAVLLAVCTAEQSFDRIPFPRASVAIVGVLIFSRFAEVAFRPEVPMSKVVRLQVSPLPVWENKALAAQIKPLVPHGSNPDLLVHGWDFAWYSALGKAPPELQLALVATGRLTPQQYADSLQAKHFPYILDITPASNGMRLDAQNIYSRNFSEFYSPIWNGGGMTLYRAKSIAEPSAGKTL